MEICITTSESRYTCAGSRNEVIVYDVGVALTVAVASNVATTASPVVDNLYRRC